MRNLVLVIKIIFIILSGISLEYPDTKLSWAECLLKWGDAVISRNLVLIKYWLINSGILLFHVSDVYSDIKWNEYRD